ncbi:MAG: Fur family transcriptional regulator [Candidatus Dojkabacteria bacterium]
MKNLRHSKKRDLILEVFQNGDLLDANEVCAKVPQVDRATIYRNLTLFVEQGVLREVNIKKGITHYELNHEGDIHQHFVCDDCDKVIPVDVDPNLIKSLVPEGVELKDFELNLKGKCGECK